ncbi:MAG: FadR family transcriptional regulator [Clostridia bacterium]|nr:FadR family transcriptional regulator [Clostridia bacterium]
MKFEPIKRVRIYEEIAMQIRNLIVNGKLKPNQALPTEKELADTFDVSLVSVRQALTVLETLGLIARKRGRGIFIVSDEIDFIDGNSNDISDFEVFWFTDHDPEMTTITEILEVRRMIEPRIAQLAARRADKKDLERLKKCAGRKIINTGDAAFACREFHTLLSYSTKNNIIIDLLDGIINNVIWDTRERKAANSEAWKKSIEGHRLIFEAVKNRDSNAAYRAMFNHLKEIEMLMFFETEERIDA